MSAQFDGRREMAEAHFEPLLADRLEEVMRVEQRAYASPWSRTNFLDALHSGYQAQMLMANGYVLGYFVAMKGVDEVHLLNITVAPEFQGQGWSRVMLDALALWARGQGAEWLWLEVRVGNVRAIKVYEAHGYRRVGLRKAYYPAGHGQREDAIVMSLRL
ncbi:ribosomal protein S18-alanine N-acetyltransferase [Rhodoferax sp. GW822-FHT02A01]|uniref:ribosomal protein S18-alanine N-acetyltransferase n=1 Tax=Rhodoferax sp. GW822-FHT02A01 TaxID=3141537 RepID=UPI00315DA7DC